MTGPAKSGVLVYSNNIKALAAFYAALFSMVPEGAVQSTQAAFGKVLYDLAKSDEALADRIYAEWRTRWR